LYLPLNPRMAPDPWLNGNRAIVQTSTSESQMSGLFRKARNTKRLSRLLKASLSFDNRTSCSSDGTPPRSRVEFWGGADIKHSHENCGLTLAKYPRLCFGIWRESWNMRFEPVTEVKRQSACSQRQLRAPPHSFERYSLKSPPFSHYSSVCAPSRPHSEPIGADTPANREKRDERPRLKAEGGD
jgi:hypothetical protein